MIVSAGAGELDGAKANAAGVTTREAPVSRSKSARAGTTVCLKLPRRARLELGESTARTSVGRIVPVPLSVKSGAEPALRQLCDDGAGTRSSVATLEQAGRKEILVPGGATPETTMSRRHSPLATCKAWRYAVPK
jgi:hypothetical protein